MSNDLNPNRFDPSPTGTFTVQDRHSRSLEEQLQKRRHLLETREKRLDEREHDLDTREEHLEDREAQLACRQAELGCAAEIKEDELADREQALQAWEQRLVKKENDVALYVTQAQKHLSQPSQLG